MSGERVLVVEDDQSIGTGLIQALRNAEHDATLVPTGAAALESLETELPELVLLDLGLPDIDGIDLCRQIRDRSAHRDPHRPQRRDRDRGRPRRRRR